ncbi:hypothetical protein V5O48_010072 [Marasmius crinis-equi]|uniref:Monooxygenase n=1 Tax=Marasmius crinis-equi TaxID=585013 RepID=A0ABR3F9E7_9AGAR
MPPRIVIVGAGVGGIAFAVGLRKKFPDFDNFVIYEKASDVGGTWRDNTYPGCSSDVSVHFYSLSTDLNPDWDFSHGSQGEIHQYLRRVVAEHGLSSHIRYNTQVTSATWNPAESKYVITTKTAPRFDTSKERIRTPLVADGEAEAVEEAEILISAVGPLEVVKFPDVAGLDKFTGSIFHAGNWDHSVDLKGKKVAVIGNATSAAQIVPTISEDPSVDVTNFCRTPSWFVPSKLIPYTAAQKWLFRYVPFYMRLHRFRLFLSCDLTYFFVFANSKMRNKIQKRLAEYIRKTAPEEYHDKLIPDYTPGCKRLIMDRNRYLKCLHRPNVRLNWDGIEAVTEKGMLTKKDEKLSFDVMIFATGYVVDEYPLHIKGPRETVKEYYRRKGGPAAYMGSAVPGFPNFFVIGGPNTGTGHTSFIFTEEVQVQYILKLITPVLSQDISSIEVSSEATDNYLRRIDNRMKDTVFLQCSSWYRTNGTGRISMIFPGSAMMFWWWLRCVDWDHYQVSAKNPVAWKRNVAWQRQKKILRNVAVLCVAVIAVARTGVFGKIF